jgi:hypothetical protein
MHSRPCEELLYGYQCRSGDGYGVERAPKVPVGPVTTAARRRSPGATIRPNGTARRGAPCSLSSSARNKPYMCEHLRNILYALRTSAVALLSAGAFNLISTRSRVVQQSGRSREIQPPVQARPHATADARSA